MSRHVAAVVHALSGRPVRSYPALVSTDADAQAWARSGGPSGAVVVAGYQVAPRGRADTTWDVDADRDLVLSLIVRPRLSDQREGWLYVAALVGVSDTVGPGATIVWPDEVRRGDATVAAIGWHVELGPGRVDWAVLTVWLRDMAGQPTFARRVVERVEARLADDSEAVRGVARSRCETLGRHVRALLVPMGPAGPRIEGTATDLLDDGSLLVVTPAGGRIPVTPQGLGQLEPLD